MRSLLDFLAQYVEPYVSFRWLLGIVFTAIFVCDLLGTWFTLRDLGRSEPGATAREQSFRRVARASMLLMLARLLSWDTARRHRAMIVEISLLLVAALALNAFIFFEF